MLHRAILGSFERFIGILIEQYAGRFPLWLAPVQAVVATIASDADDYAREVARRAARGRARAADRPRNEKINYKVREHSLAPGPGAAGGRAARGGERARWRCAGWAAQAQEMLALDEAVARLAAEAAPPDLPCAALESGGDRDGHDALDPNRGLDRHHTAGPYGLFPSAHLPR